MKPPFYALAIVVLIIVVAVLAGPALGLIAVGSADSIIGLLVGLLTGGVGGFQMGKSQPS